MSVLRASRVLVVVVMFLNHMTSHKLQQKLYQLFHCHQSILYSISKVLCDYSCGNYWNRWWHPPITTNGKNAMYGCMHVFLCNAQTNGPELFTIYQTLWIYKYNINLDEVQCIIEIISSEFIENMNQRKSFKYSYNYIWHISATLFYSQIFLFTLNSIFFILFYRDAFYSCLISVYRCMHYTW